MYRNRARSDNPPHVFAMADAAYHAMLHQRRSQCIVISGESGAGSWKKIRPLFLFSSFNICLLTRVIGKTVTANYLLKQLVTLGKVFHYFKLKPLKKKIDIDLSCKKYRLPIVTWRKRYL